MALFTPLNVAKPPPGGDHWTLAAVPGWTPVASTATVPDVESSAQDPAGCGTDGRMAAACAATAGAGAGVAAGLGAGVGAGVAAGVLGAAAAVVFAGAGVTAAAEVVPASGASPAVRLRPVTPGDGRCPAGATCLAGPPREPAGSAPCRCPAAPLWHPPRRPAGGTQGRGPPPVPSRAGGCSWPGGG